MMITKKIFSISMVLLFLLAACQPDQVQQTTMPESKLVIGYYPAWAAQQGRFLKDMPVESLTQLNYAFANVSVDGECVLGDLTEDVERVYNAEESVSGQADDPAALFHGNFNQVLQLKKQYPDLKVLISIGGWTWSGNFSNAAKDDASRQRFASSCVDLFLKQYPGVFDGLDIDWEYPVSGGLSDGMTEDRQNFTLLLEEVRGQLDELGAVDGKHYLLTIAAPTGTEIIRNLDLEGITASVDWINLMAYDFHGLWESTTNFNAPLFRSTDDPADAGLTADAAVQTYLAGGVPAGKLVLGVPFYGKGWAGVENVNNGLYQAASGMPPGSSEGAFSYNDLRDRYLADWSYFWDDQAHVPWLYDAEEKVFISFDDARSLEAKAGYAKDQGLAGVMIWEISQGDASLMQAILEGLGEGKRE